MEDEAIAAVIDGIAGLGYAIVRNAMVESAVAALRGRVRELEREGAFASAQVGRGGERAQRADIRGDRIAWLAGPGSTAEESLAAWLETMRERCNRELFLGLVDFEGHYASYPIGARYARHRDRFRDDDARVLSCVLYLNEGWTASDGGALRLYTPDGTLDVLPQSGTFVAFLASQFDHEVLPASRERVSLTGWYRRRTMAAAC